MYEPCYFLKGRHKFPCADFSIYPVFLNFLFQSKISACRPSFFFGKLPPKNRPTAISTKNMTNLDFTDAELIALITHHVGNKSREENFVLSSETTLLNEDTKGLLMKYFLQPIRPEEFYCFSHPVELAMNDVFSMAAALFDDPAGFIPFSQNVAKLLYDHSLHPKIKAGELNIAHFANVVLGDETVEVVGIFKSETDAPFIQMKHAQSRFVINHEFGFEIKSMDKGCLIFNSDKENGYKILLIDAVKQSAEAQYWKNDFLNAVPVANEFHQTSQFMGLAKNFVTKHLAAETEIGKAEKIDMLNRSVDYFKTHETFDKLEFTDDVFQDEGIKKSFVAYDKIYREENNIDPMDNFDISPLAVKKQAKVFKSVLKLDKNFHIYIHGDTDLIQQGIDSDGRKFYKIYFNQES